MFIGVELVDAVEVDGIIQLEVDVCEVDSGVRTEVKRVVLFVLGHVALRLHFRHNQGL